MARRFLGLWRLLPQHCKYDVGQPPIKATYEFKSLPDDPTPQNPKNLSVEIKWTDVHSKDFDVKYRIHLLGKKQIEEINGVKMQVLHELIEQGILKSTSFMENGQTVIMQSFRQLKQNDKYLDVLMIKPTEKGNHNIMQRYQKDEQQ